MDTSEWIQCSNRRASVVCVDLKHQDMCGYPYTKTDLYVFIQLKATASLMAFVVVASWAVAAFSMAILRKSTKRRCEKKSHRRQCSNTFGGQ